MVFQQSLSQTELSVDQCVKLIPLIPVDELNCRSTVKNTVIMQALTQLQPSSCSIGWIKHLIGNADDDWWYVWNDYDERSTHFIAAHPRYYEQYILSGGDPDYPADLAIDNRTKLSDISDYRLTVTGDDLEFWWPVMPVNIDQNDALTMEIVKSVQLRRDYAVILGHVSYDTKHPNINPDDVYRITCEYHICSAIDPNAIIENLDAICDVIDSVTSNTVSNDITDMIITSTRTNYIITIMSMYMIRDIQVGNLSKLAKGTGFEKEAHLIDKHGYRARIALCNNVAIKIILGLPVECGIDNDDLMDILDKALNSTVRYRARIREQNIQRLQEYQNSLPYMTEMPKDDDIVIANLTYGVIYDVLPFFLIPYDEEGKVKYYPCGERIMKFKNPMVERAANHILDTSTEYFKLHGVTFTKAVEIMSGRNFHMAMMTDSGGKDGGMRIKQG